VPDDLGGAIVVWEDGRNGVDWDIYASHLDALATGIRQQVPVMNSITLLPNAPNPFSTGTHIRFELSRESDVLLEFFDVSGRRILTRMLESRGSGGHVISFDGRSANGIPLPSGVYMYRVRDLWSSATGKITIQR
jgi:hypothetical protein